MIENVQIDTTGWKLLTVLQKDARLSFSEIGRRVGLSAPAVAERVRRMESLGIITGYHTNIAPNLIGYSISAFTEIKTNKQNFKTLTNLLPSIPGIIECHHLAGLDGFLVKIIAPSTETLESIILKLQEYGETKTSIVLSSLINKKIIDGNAAIKDN